MSDMLAALEAQQFSDNTIAAVWAPVGITYDFTVIFNRQVPKKDQETGEVLGKQFKIRGIMNNEATGVQPNKIDPTTGMPVQPHYAVGTELNVYVDAGKKTEALVNAMKALGMRSLPAGTRIVWQHYGLEPAKKAGNSPTKLHACTIYPPTSGEAQASPYYAHAIERGREEDEKEALRSAPIGGAGIVPQPMAAQVVAPIPVPQPMAAVAPAAVPVAPVAAPVAPVAAPVAAAPVAAPVAAVPPPIAAAPVAAPVVVDAAPVAVQPTLDQVMGLTN